MKSTSLLPTLIFVMLLVTPSLDAAPGDLDPSFGTGGVVTTDVTAFQDFGGNMALQGDGKIVVVSSSGDIGSRDFGLVRYLADGTLDPDFGTGGIVVTSLGGGDDFPEVVAVHADGKIVLVGNADVGGGNIDVGIVRYNSDGTEDASFGTNGISIPSTPGLNESVEDMILQPDGKIIVVGFAGEEFMFVMRYLTDGTLDTSFDEDGSALIKINGNNATGRGVALQSDGKIVIGGSEFGDDVSMAVVRLNEDGSLDSSFGTDGTVSVASELMDSSGFGVAIQADGKIVILGNFEEDEKSVVILARLLSDGTMDPDFGTAGVITQLIGGVSFETKELALQVDGFIVVAGLLRTQSDESLTAVRFKSNGELDLTFSEDGIVSQGLSDNERVTGLTIQPDGKILVGGSDGTNIAVVRLLGSNAELSISKTSDLTEVKVGDTITFTVSVANAGPDPTGVRMDDTLPPQLSLVSDSVTTADGSCSTDPTFICFLSVAAGSSATVTYSAIATAEGTVGNTATLISQIEESDTGDNSTTTTASLLPSGGCQLIR